MNFFHLPTELRFEIYEYLLVSELPIYINCEKDGPWDGFTWPDPPNPQILRVNKRMLHEASPMLYSRNQLSIWGEECYGNLDTGKTAAVAIFLARIGRQARLIRYIETGLRAFDHRLWGECGPTDIHDLDRENLAAIRLLCPNIRTIQFRLSDSSRSSYRLGGGPVPPDTPAQLHTLAANLKDIPWLEKVIIHIGVFTNKDDQEPEDDEQTSAGNDDQVNTEEPVEADDAEVITGPDIAMMGNGNHTRKQVAEMERVVLSYGWDVDMGGELKRRTWRSSDNKWVFYNE
ncbi:hypothetical protein PG997_014724 [Apiospora hydei]|uniref:F-box domain-containing protein n=1 Tax=Apiospora hydei TaxID=1337664 RepID=A0ABR1UUN4_9PEZI